MWKTILLYGLLGGILVVVLQITEYRFLVLEHSLQIYGGIVAAIFAALGIWLGLKLTKTREVIVEKAPQPFAINQSKLTELGISPREHEILTLIAAGMSNREIAEKLFVSENTVKTHLGNLFEKLNAKRRTQAVQIAKESGLIA